MGWASPQMKKIMKIAKNYKIKVVEDACMGIGGKLNGNCQVLFDIGAFSIPFKIIKRNG